MAGRMLRSVLIVGACSGLIAVPCARSDGPPVLGFGVGQPVRSPSGTVTYSALPTGGHTLLSERSSRGRTLLARRLSGRFIVPIVAFDGSSAGISADGRTLVLVAPRQVFPRRSTALALVDGATLRPRRYLRLGGDFSFDAISPTGRWIYLIQYTSPGDANQYKVRALDADSGRLLRGAIIDPHDRGEAMRGYPITRVNSGDGRWAYTLYSGSERPFVHALNTATLTARCIDLPSSLAGPDPTIARMTLDPRRRLLLVRFGRRTVAAIDTASLSVVRSRVARGRTAGTAVGIAFPIAAAVVLLGIGLLALRRRFAPAPKTAGAR